MLSKQIFFTGIHKAELLEKEVRPINENEVLVKMEYTVISGGTERACILGMNNTSQRFPTSLGYCGVGLVEEIGKDVKKVNEGYPKAYAMRNKNNEELKEIQIKQYQLILNGLANILPLKNLKNKKKFFIIGLEY